MKGKSVFTRALYRGSKHVLERWRGGRSSGGLYLTGQSGGSTDISEEPTEAPKCHCSTTLMPRTSRTLPRHASVASPVHPRPTPPRPAHLLTFATAREAMVALSRTTCLQLRTSSSLSCRGQPTVAATSSPPPPSWAITVASTGRSLLMAAVSAAPPPPAAEPPPRPRPPLPAAAAAAAVAAASVRRHASVRALTRERDESSTSGELWDRCGGVSEKGL